MYHYVLLQFFMLIIADVCNCSKTVLRTGFHIHSFTFNPSQNLSPDSLFTDHFLIPKQGYNVQKQMVVTNFMIFFSGTAIGC